MTFTILTWFWKQPGGRAQYDAAAVNTWAGMVRRHLHMPHEIACVTDHPEGIDPRVRIIAPPGDFEDVRIPTWGKERPQCLRRIAMFRPDAASIFGERFACMDMDCVIQNDITPLFSDPVDFKMFAGTHRSRPYNGSLMMMTAGARPHVYERFNRGEAVKAGKQYVGSDQAWISYVLGRGEKTWGYTDGIQAFGSAYANDKARVTFFFGLPKPWEIPQHPLVRKHYRASAEGRCLILAHGPSVWADAEAALALGDVTGVIACPEAAEVWPGPLLATCLMEYEGLATAHKLGYDSVTVCGDTRGQAGQDANSIL